MKINDVVNDYLSEALTTSAPAEYQQMTDFVKNNRTAGVPADQQVALVLFKELQKQKQQNQALSSELSAAEERIDQALDSGELSQQELGMHRAELDRERAAGAEQQAAVGQLGQQYSERDKASRQQINDLGDKLEAVKNTPGVDQDSVDRLEQQIKDLGKNGIGADKVQELERSIAAIQNAESTDDAAIKDLIAQVKAAQDATAELAKTKQNLGKDAEEIAKRALDQVEQMKQQLAHFREVEQTVAALQPMVTDVLTPKVNQLVKAQEFDNKIKTLRAAKAFKAAETPDQLRQTVAANTRDAMSMPDPAQSITPTPQPPVAESAFARSVAWAIGKIK